MGDVTTFRGVTQEQDSARQRQLKSGSVTTTFDALIMLRLYYSFVEKDENKFIQISNQIALCMRMGDIYPVVPLMMEQDYRTKVIPNFMKIKEQYNAMWNNG